MNFDFSTLNSADLELLVRDLWNAEAARRGTNIAFKAFKDGKDRGIDLLAAGPEGQYRIVGQVKHYYRSGYAKLIKDLKDKELPKIMLLGPERCRMATSVDLGVRETEELLFTLKPYIKSVHDIYGKKELNDLLNEFPHLLERHFKLWYSSTAVLQKVLQQAVFGRSEEMRSEHLQRKLRLYVKTDALDQALQILNKKNVLIITGDPGIGKTTLAELLTIELIREGYEFTYIYDDIKEMESVLRRDDSKQLFYFDDFFGHNSFEIAKTKSSESAVINLVSRIRRSVNKKLILTTRTFILNTAIDESEKLRAANLKKDESIISISQYDEAMRSQILRNHTEEAELPDEFKELILQTALFRFLVHHPNFYPRSIEYITTPANVENLTAVEFVSFVYANFNSPANIWRHAYERQLQDIDRFFLNTLLSFGHHANLHLFEEAFLGRLSYENQYYHFHVPMQAFRHCLKRLEGGFIKMASYMDLYDTEVEDYIEFVNFSLPDFLINYLTEDRLEVIRMAESAVFSKQLVSRLYPLDNNTGKIFVPERLQYRLVHENEPLIRNDTDRATIALILIRHVDDPLAKAAAVRLLTNITSWEDISNKDNLTGLLENILIMSEVPELITAIKDFGYAPFAMILYWMYDFNDVFRLQSVMASKYQFDIADLFQSQSNYDWSTHFTGVLEGYIAVAIEALLEEQADEDKTDSELRKILGLKRRMNELGVITNPDLTPFYSINDRSE